MANGNSVHRAAAGNVLIFGKAGSGSYTATGGTNGGEGGTLFFSLGAEGGTARGTVLGNALLQLSTHDSPELTIGSLEGDGMVLLRRWVSVERPWPWAKTNWIRFSPE